MTAEELAANQRATAALGANPVARDVARWASARELAPGAMAAIALGFGVIGAVWLTADSVHTEVVAFPALIAAFITGRAGRLMGNRELTAAAEWSLAACAALTELALYAGIATGASGDPANAGLTGPAGVRLRGTAVAGLGGQGTAGVWRLAVAAVGMLAVLQMVGICQAARRAAVPRAPRFQAFAGAPGGARLLLIGAAVLIGGARVTFLMLLVLGVLALGTMLAGRSAAGSVAGGNAAAGPVPAAGSAAQSRWLPWCRGDGPFSLWIGQFVEGRLPPLPPLLVGLLVTGVLAWLGLQNLPGILVFTPVEAMLLAALGSRHPHDGPRDWLAPALLQAGEYLFLAALGFAYRAWAPVTLALVGAVMMRHLDLACRARYELARSADRRGLGWEGRMFVAGLAAALGILPYVYPLLAAYLWGLLAWEWATSGLVSAGHSAVDG